MTPLRLVAAMLLCAAVAGAQPAPWEGTAIQLDVPNVEQRRERCGQAALEMVFRHLGLTPTALEEAERAYDPILRGSLITDLAAAARRAGYDARIAALTPDSLVSLLAAGVPPIVLYQAGRAPITRPHFGVVTGWDPARQSLMLNDGSRRPRVVALEAWAGRWRKAGSQALILQMKAP